MQPFISGFLLRWSSDAGFRHVQDVWRGPSGPEKALFESIPPSDQMIVPNTVGLSQFLYVTVSIVNPC